MIKHVFFDFNGTIINDLDLCFNLLNEFLEEQGKEKVTKERYKDIFRFPIKEYYKLAGIDFDIESYESLSIKFIKEYQPASLKCGLYDAVIPTLKKLNEKNIKCYIISASEKNNLYEQCLSYDIVKYFVDILGIENIHAKSKVDIAVNYINEKKLNKDEVIFIGDTLHDVEVAKAMGVKPLLVSCGHQSVNVLKAANVKIYDDVSGVLEEIENEGISK